jgi:hypothetical protein
VQNEALLFPNYKEVALTQAESEFSDENVLVTMLLVVLKVKNWLDRPVWVAENAMDGHTLIE